MHQALIAGVRGYGLLLSPQLTPTIPSSVFLGITQICFFHLAITLAKFTEYYERYKAILPPAVKSSCLELYKNIKGRGIVRFRNTITGRLFDRHTGKPVPTLSLTDLFAEMFRGSFQDFVAWIGDGDEDPTSVVATIAQTRDALWTHYRLTDADIRPDDRSHFPS